MATSSQTTGDMLVKLGRRLQRIRLERLETMAQFAKHLNISEATLRSLERGRPGVPIGRWVEVLAQLKRLEELDLLLSSQTSEDSPAHQARRHRMRTRIVRPMAR